MSKENCLTVKVGCELDVDELSAEFALKAVNLYCNNNNLWIKKVKGKMKFAEQDDSCWDCSSRDNIIKLANGKEKVANFCPTCGRCLKNEQNT